MEIEIISSFCIKPSHPTRQHLKIHHLSLLDQFVPPNYAPILVFYTVDSGEYNTLPHKLQLLRQSLSDTLTRFYPFAGIIKDRLSIDCNDRGIHYSEAKANSNLIHLFEQPDLQSSLHKLLPSIRSSEGDQVAMIQVTTFACGGLAIGLNMSHRIADGFAASHFLNTWGGAARKAIDHYVCPNFEAPPAIFPHRADVLPEGTGFMALSGPSIEISKVATRRLRFAPGAIAKLRSEGSSSIVPNPTRVEIVSAFIWKCMMAALKTDSVLITYAVNLRRKALPAFPESYMGNLTWAACSSSAILSSDREAQKEEKDVKTELLPSLVVKLREAITKIDSDFVKSLQGEEGLVRFCEALGEMTEKASGVGAFLRLSSVCGLGFYNIDFGWGKPAWAIAAGFTDAETVYYNTVFLGDTASGDEIEALIHLQGEGMAILERDPELLAFATLDPNPLQVNAHV